MAGNPCWVHLIHSFASYRFTTLYLLIRSCTSHNKHWVQKITLTFCIVVALLMHTWITLCLKTIIYLGKFLQFQLYSKMSLLVYNLINQACLLLLISNVYWLQKGWMEMYSCIIFFRNQTFCLLLNNTKCVIDHIHDWIEVTGGDTLCKFPLILLKCCYHSATGNKWV